MRRNPAKLCFIFLPIILLTIADITFAQDEDLRVLHNWIEWSDAPHMLIHHLNKQAFTYLDIRGREIEKLQTRADWLQWQQQVRQTLMKIVGPFPERTPLNPQITGTIQKKGYRVEKIIFQSRPNFYVTGCLFIPDNIKGKRPAILNVIGHTDIAFRDELYQVLILNLVKKGFIVFAIDPIGQGERLQYFDAEKGKSIIGGPTSEHSYVGNQCFLCGVSLARYFIWDGMRAIDYLISRKEVDPNRIGVTGISGGGTQTTYISAFDDRVKAAAPACYITGFRRLLESIGPQDAEQNFYHGVAESITHADLLEVRAPKPTLIVSTTRDFFSIQGVRETFHEVQKAYRAFGMEDHIDMVEDDYGHGYTPKNRKAIYAFFQKYLDLPGDTKDEPVEILSHDELTVTSTGQVSSSLGGESVFSLNKKDAERLIDRLDESRKAPEKHLQKARERAIELSGYANPDPKVKSVFRGRYHRDGYSVEMYALQGEGNYVIPLLLFIPSGAEQYPAIIYLHPDGKSAEAAPGGEIETLVREGYIVAAPDVIGIGETKSDRPRESYAALLIGRSIVGIQAGDVSRVVNFLLHQQNVKSEAISAIASGVLCTTLLHAAAFNDRISKITLREPLISFRSLVLNRFYKYDFAYAVPGALTAYDLPDLLACLAPRRVLLIDPQDQLLHSASEDLIEQELSFSRKIYTSLGAKQKLNVLTQNSADISSILHWLKGGK